MTALYTGFHRHRRAASLTGYALIVGLIAVVAVAALQSVGSQVNVLFSSVGDKLDSAATGNHSASQTGSGSEDPVNTAPSYSGGAVSVPSLIQDVLMTPVDIAGFFDSDGDSLAFSAIGSWPAGITVSKVDDTTARISGTPLASGTYPNLRIQADDGNDIVETADFTMTVTIPATTWNPADMSAGTYGITLSNGNLTANIVSGGNNIQGARATSGKSAGRYYWEVTADNASYPSIGIAQSSWDHGNGTLNSPGPGPRNPPITADVTVSGLDFYGWYSFSGQVIPTSSGVSFNSPSYASGTVLRFALDLEDGRLWFGDNNGSCRWRLHGSNQSSTDDLPGTGTSPAITGLSGTWYPAFYLQSYQNSTPQITANFGEDNFTCPVPAGFTEGFY